MRQRKIKNLEEKMEYLSDLVAEDPASVKGRWRELFDGQGPGENADDKRGEDQVTDGRGGDRAETGNDDRVPFYAEVGCGKGKFIQNMALIHPERRYVAFEGNQSVVYHAMQKADESGLANIRFVTDYIDMMDEFFDSGELDGIYLNFSDPWPKYKHEKRRLTAGKRLDSYVKAVKPGGFIEFRTDNDDLFEYTMNELMEQSGIKIVAVTNDLHGEIHEIASRIDLGELTDCGFEDGVDEKLTTLEDLSVTSEYEDKFSSQGKGINFVHVKVI